MGIDLSSNATMYADLIGHVGHDIECVSYGNGENVAVECVTCGMVLVDADHESVTDEEDDEDPHRLRPLLDELERAQQKHGERFVRNLPWCCEEDMPLLKAMSRAGIDARLRCESDCPSQVAVLMEEIGEVADALLAGEPVAGEVAQAVAMSLALWWGLHELDKDSATC